MTLKPKQVVEALTSYYYNHPGCHGRTSHLFGAETTQAYDQSREIVKRFINASSSDEIIFVRNATEGLNIIANCLDLKENDIVVSSDIEHNSNLLPWQLVERKKRIKRVSVSTNPDTSFNLDNFKSVLTERVKLVSVLYTSNLSGITFPVEDIIRLAHDHGALVCIDAAQAALCKPIDVKKLNVDFMVMSLHKMWGPSGMGVLYGKRKFLELFPQFLTGGETVEDATWYDHILEASIPKRFEAGLQDYAGVIGSGAAVEYINKLGQKRIHQMIIELNEYATDKILKLNEIELIGPETPEKRSGILNFFIKGLNVGDVARLLNEAENIMTRFGKHCVHSWFNKNNYPDSLRVSFSAYNTFEEIDILIATLRNIIKHFK